MLGGRFACGSTGGAAVTMTAVATRLLLTAWLSSKDNNNCVSRITLVACVLWNGSAAFLLHAPSSVNSHQLRCSMGQFCQTSGVVRVFVTYFLLTLLLTLTHQVFFTKWKCFLSLLCCCFYCLPKKGGKTLHGRHHHDVYRRASLGAATPASCVNYTEFFSPFWPPPFAGFFYSSYSML